MKTDTKKMTLADELREASLDTGDGAICEHCQVLMSRAAAALEAKDEALRESILHAEGIRKEHRSARIHKILEMARVALSAGDA